MMAENDEAQNKDSYQNLVASNMEMASDHLDQRSFKDLYGVDKTIGMLKENIAVPLLFPEVFKNYRSPRAIMVFGAPGCGKTHLLSAAANESNAKLFVFNLWNLQNRMLVTKSHCVDECIKTVYEIAWENSPSILCFEDLEVFSKPDDHFRNGKISFLYQSDKFFARLRDETDDKVKVFVIGVTQKPWEVDPAVRKRFVRPYGSHVNLPSEEARKDILKVLCSGFPHSLRPEDFETLARATQGFTGSDLNVIVRDASMQAMRCLSKATHFKKVSVISPGKPSTEMKTDEQGRQEDESSSSLTDCQDCHGKENNLSECKHSRQSRKYENCFQEQFDSSKRSKESSGLDESALNEMGVDVDITTSALSNLSFDKSDGIDLSETFNREPDNTDLCKDDMNKMLAYSNTDISDCQKKANTDCDQGNEDLVVKFVPCQADDSGAIPMSVFEIPEEDIYVRELNMQDMEEALKGIRGSVSEEDLQKLSQFESDF